MSYTLLAGTRSKSRSSPRKRKPRCYYPASNWKSALRNGLSDLSFLRLKPSSQCALQRVETALNILYDLSEALYSLHLKEDETPLLHRDIVLSFKILGQTIDYAFLDTSRVVSKRQLGLQAIAEARMKIHD